VVAGLIVCAIAVARCAREAADFVFHLLQTVRKPAGFYVRWVWMTVLLDLLEDFKDFVLPHQPVD
jgi:hypothetical protein